MSINVDREREEDARRYFDEHGEWPEGETRRGRRWTLAPGVMTAEDEEAEGQPYARKLAQRSRPAVLSDPGAQTGTVSV